MKKVLLSLALLAGLGTAAQAQSTRFGIKGGVGLATIGGDYLVFKNKNLVTAQGGIMADIGLSDLISFHPELLYSQKGVRREAGTLYIQDRSSYLDLPLLLRVNADGLFFEAGPQLGYLLGNKREANNSGSVETSTSTNNLRKFDVGYIAGVGYQLPMGLEFGIRYNGGITDVNDPSGLTKYRNSVFQFQVGYLFGGK